MKSRSAFEICLPTLILGLACLLSTPTLILSFLWMFVGAVCVGHRDIGSFSERGVPYRWRYGWRSAFLWVYHLAWWPWYMRVELSQILQKSLQRINAVRMRHEGDRSNDTPRHNDD